VKVAEIALPKGEKFTGGDIDPTGTGLLLRTYKHLYELRLPTTGATFEDLFAAPLRSVPVAKEKQGESVAWRPDGRGYYTLSEGKKQKIYEVGPA